MKKELNYFTIDGQYGGNQNLLKNFFMRMGGCGAVTACDSCIYFSKHMGKKMYPFDEQNLNYNDFVEFTDIMRPYLSPRITGINKLSIYIDGFNKYLKDRHIDYIDVKPFAGDRNFSEAKEILKTQIDKSIPVPTLVLKHKNKSLKNYVWHWFILGGYEQRGEKFFVKAITEGKYAWIDFEQLWNTGYSEKGGLIIYDIK